MRDPYKTLGVDRNATADDIKRAYRKLASQHHPDRGGDTARFQEIQQAYDTLTNPRSQHSQGNAGANPFNNGPFGFAFGTGFGFDDLFNMFNQQQAQQRRNHVKLTLWVDLADVAKGGKRTVSVGTQMGVQAADIDIPLGINDGDHVQYRGLGPGGMDLVVEFRVRPHAQWERHKLDLVMDYHAVIWDLICGATVNLTDIHGQRLDAEIPAMTQPGTLLRLRQRGLRDPQGNHGDAFVRIYAHLPESIPDDLRDAIQKYHNK